jgi:hypothetical protein
MNYAPWLGLPSCMPVARSADRTTCGRKGSLVASTAVNPQGQKAGALPFGRIGEGGDNINQDHHIDRRAVG